ncbi:MAG: DUF58 domain-containing protein [Clostridia bacterium]|nr:DUF58 domain-containing protein [Clostridia bacterium]
MKTHIAFPLAFLITFLLAALSTGSSILMLLAVLLLMGLLFGLVSVLWASRTLRLSGDLDAQTVHRGEAVQLRLQVCHRGLLPIAPILLEISPGAGLPLQEVYLRDVPSKLQTLTLPVHANHVGEYTPGVQAWAVEDLLGFFRVRRSLEDARFRLLVLPNRFETEPLILSPGDPGSEMLQQATEDLSAPSDIRSYQPGDPMKKIHWKLSLRKGELLVRKFEEPILKEVLILMDCSRPPSWGRPAAEADLRDALLETAASVFADQANTDLVVHLPLHGVHPIELEKTMGIPLAMESLARVDFSDPDRFERVLTLESRRLRKVGCLVVISARLNSAMVDVMTRMHHLGPTIRLYLVTFAPEDPRLLPLIARLQQDGIQVAYVQPTETAGEPD